MKRSGFDLEAMGWSAEWATRWTEKVGSLPTTDADGLVPARITQEQRGAHTVACKGGELIADVSGRLRYIAVGGEDLPAVGDWVAVAPRWDESRATIHHVLERSSALIRKVPERPAAAQVLAANLDHVFVVASANRDFNARRIERTVALVREGGALPVVLVSKSDLAEEADRLREEAVQAAPGCPVHVVSALTGAGVEALAVYLQPGETVALIGSSGVGKSTLANRLVGEEVLATSAIRHEDDKGRHTTSHRQIVFLPGGGLLLDTPGLREVGLWGDDAGGIESAFPDVEALVGACRFANCGHGNEPGCAIRGAIESGDLDPERYDSYTKLAREAERLQKQRDARGRHEQRKEAKRFSKMVRRLPNKRGDR